jgi:hypothetical protein
MVSIVVAVVTYLLTKRKERKADWRKSKLDLYRAYVLALSGVVQWNKTSEDQAKYAEAVNGLTLVASPLVLQALYAFQDTVSGATKSHDETTLDKRLNDLLKALRQDIYPTSNGRDKLLFFRFMAPPPRHANDHSSSQPGQ